MQWIVNDFAFLHLIQLQTLIAASMFNIGANPLLVHAPGVILNNTHQQYFSPDAVLHLLGLLSGTKFYFSFFLKDFSKYFNIFFTISTT